MRKKLVDIACWSGLYLFWVMVFQRRELAFVQTATVEFCYLLFIAANYYFNASINIPRFLHSKKYVTFTLLFVVGIIVTALARVPLAALLNRAVFIPGKPQPGFSVLFTKSLINIGFWTACIVAGKLVLDRLRFQQYIDEVKQQKEQAELDFLNAQFNPHFLFNSINSIYAHIDKQNTAARNMLLTFSDMLRYQLYECNDSMIPIEKELDYIKNYVALQKVRKSGQLDVAVHIPDEVKCFRITPLLFIAFIENSFKYVGSGEEPGDHVHISFCRENGSLLFMCRNSVAGWQQVDEHGGIGLSNAKRRLELLYPRRHELRISQKNETFEVNLKINIDETELHYS